VNRRRRPHCRGCSGKRRKPKTRYSAEDDAGKVVDLHALRVTCGTRLARMGVAPQVGKDLLRHAD
jgi:hypothetical protein